MTCDLKLSPFVLHQSQAITAFALLGRTLVQKGRLSNGTPSVAIFAPLGQEAVFAYPASLVISPSI